MLSLIHEAHLEKCKNRTPENMFCHKILKIFYKNDAVCAKFHKNESNKPLRPHSISDRPFQKIGIVLMFYKGINYCYY